MESRRVAEYLDRIRFARGSSGPAPCIAAASGLGWPAPWWPLLPANWPIGRPTILKRRLRRPSRPHWPRHFPPACVATADPFRLHERLADSASRDRPRIRFASKPLPRPRMTSKPRVYHRRSNWNSRLTLHLSSDRNSASLLQQRARHDYPLNLVGPLVDLSDLGVTHEPFHWKVLGIAVAAKELHRVGGDFHRHVGGEALRRR
jgi:hypothetical protein